MISVSSPRLSSRMRASAVATNVFPSPWAPNIGAFNLELARALAFDHQVRVVCPVPWVIQLGKNRRKQAAVFEAQAAGSGRKALVTTWTWIPRSSNNGIKDSSSTGPDPHAHCLVGFGYASAPQPARPGDSSGMRIVTETVDLAEAQTSYG